MPLDGRMSKEQMFKEVRHGAGYKKTAAKHGKETARKQMIARVLEKRRGKKSRSSKR